MKDKYVALLLGILYFVIGVAYLLCEGFTEKSVGIIIAGCGLLCMMHLHEYYKKKDEEEDGEDYPETVEVSTTSIVSWTGPKEELLKLINEFEKAGWIVCVEFQKYKNKMCYLDENVFTTSMQKDD